MRRALLVALFACLAGGADAAEEASLLEQARAFEAEVRQTIEKIRPTVVSVFSTGGSEDERRSGAGSGVIVTAEGHVLTNDHVAGWASEVWVTLSGRRRYRAEIVGRDPEGDLCLLKLAAAGPFPCVDLSSCGTPRVGRIVLALGNPRGVSADGRAVTTIGIVTGIHGLAGGAGERTLYYGDAVQTDAEVNPGSSGGPLFDLHGCLLGINGRIVTLSRTHAAGPESVPLNARVAFAVPAEQIRRFLPHLLAGGIVRHGFLGVRTGPSDSHGLPVAFVLPDSAAKRAGIRAGDVLVAIDGERLVSQTRLTNTISSRPAGERVAVRLRRDGRERILAVTLGTRPEVAR